MKDAGRFFHGVGPGPARGAGGGGGGGSDCTPLTLPFVLDFEDVTVGEAGGWAPAYYTGVTQSAASIETCASLVSGNPYVTNCVKFPTAVAPDYAFNYVDFGGCLPTTGFRMVIQMTRYGGDRNPSLLSKLCTELPTVDDGKTALQHQCSYASDSYRFWDFDSEGTVTEWVAQSWGTNHQADGWKTHRFEVDPNNGVTSWKAEDGTNRYWGFQKTIAWKSGYSIPEGLRYFVTYNAGTGTVIGYIWIGSLIDAWPTGNPVT